MLQCLRFDSNLIGVSSDIRDNRTVSDFVNFCFGSFIWATSFLGGPHLLLQIIKDMVQNIHLRIQIIHSINVQGVYFLPCTHMTSFGGVHMYTVKSMGASVYEIVTQRMALDTKSLWMSKGRLIWGRILIQWTDWVHQKYSSPTQYPELKWEWEKCSVLP